MHLSHTLALILLHILFSLYPSHLRSQLPLTFLTHTPSTSLSLSFTPIKQPPPHPPSSYPFTYHTPPPSPTTPLSLPLVHPYQQPSRGCRAG